MLLLNKLTINSDWPKGLYKCKLMIADKSQKQTVERLPSATTIAPGLKRPEDRG